MDLNNADLTRMELRRTGRSGGCSCCSFTMLGLLAIPLAAAVSLFLLF